LSESSESPLDALRAEQAAQQARDDAQLAQQHDAELVQRILQAVYNDGVAYGHDR
jgi:hypothetical protein